VLHFVNARVLVGQSCRDMADDLQAVPLASPLERTIHRLGWIFQEGCAGLP